MYRLHLCVAKCHLYFKNVALNGAQPPLGAPAADRVAVVAGDVADLLQGQHIGGLGQLFGQAAAQLFAAGAGQVQAADQGVSGGLWLG